MAGDSDAAEASALSCARCGKPAHLQYVIPTFFFSLSFDGLELRKMIRREKLQF